MRLPGASPLIYHRGVTPGVNLYKFKFAIAGSALLAITMGQGVSHSRLAAPTELRLTGVSTPLAVEEGRPEFSWQLAGVDEKLHTVSQLAFQLRVGSSDSDLIQGRNLVWDTGKVAGRETSIPGSSYGGPAFEPEHQYAWMVRVWDEGGQASEWSRPSDWTQAPEWHARWIAADSTDAAAGDKPMPLFRKQFSVEGGVKRALLYVSGLGQYEFRINGAKVGDNELTPGWSDYRKTVFYDSYDVTSMLRGGKNALGIMLGTACTGFSDTGALYQVHRHIRAAEMHGATAH